MSKLRFTLTMRWRFRRSRSGVDTYVKELYRMLFEHGLGHECGRCDRLSAELTEFMTAIGPIRV